MPLLLILFDGYFENLFKMIFVQVPPTISDIFYNDQYCFTGTISTLDETLVSDEQKIFEKTLRRSKIAFKSRIDILKAVTGKMMLSPRYHSFIT